MRSILVVEDDASIREVLKTYLEMEGYIVFTASNGQEAIAFLKSHDNPCLILLDLMMPIMNGMEFLKAQKNDIAIAPIPVVVVSATIECIQSEDVPQCVVRKPIDMNYLMKIVCQYCGEPSP